MKRVLKILGVVVLVVVVAPARASTGS